MHASGWLRGCFCGTRETSPVPWLADFWESVIIIKGHAMIFMAVINRFLRYLHSYRVESVQWEKPF